MNFARSIMSMSMSMARSRSSLFIRSLSYYGSSKKGTYPKPQTLTHRALLDLFLKPIGPEGKDLIVINYREKIEEISQILDTTSSWSPDLENTLFSAHEGLKLETGLIIQVLERLKDLNLAMNYFGWLRKFRGRPLCCKSYSTMLKLMARTGEFDLLQKMLEEIRALGYWPMDSACCEVVEGFVKIGKVKEAAGVIDWIMKKFKKYPIGLTVFNTLICGLADAREPRLALKSFRQMMKLGDEDAVHLFRRSVRMFAEEDKPDPALFLLDALKRGKSVVADVVLYNVCIDCFGKEEKVDMAWKFFCEMRARGTNPDDVTYASMIGVLCKADRLSEAEDLFKQMGMEMEVSCAADSYNTMIMGYCSAGKIDEAYKLLGTLREKGCIPSVIAYDSLLTCLGKEGRVDEALKVFEEMKKDAEPDDSAYKIIVDMLAIAGRLEDALRVRIMYNAAEVGSNPNRQNVWNKMAYGSVIYGLCKSGEVDRAYRLLEEMKSKGWDPDENTYGSVVDGFAEIGRLDEAYMLFEEAKSKGLPMYAETFIDLCKALHKAERFEQLAIVQAFLTEVSKRQRERCR